MRRPLINRTFLDPDNFFTFYPVRIFNYTVHIPAAGWIGALHKMFYGGGGSCLCTKDARVSNTVLGHVLCEEGGMGETETLKQDRNTETRMCHTITR